MQAPATPNNPAALNRARTPLARVYWLSTFLLAAAYLSAFISAGIKSDSNWSEALLLLLAVVSTIAALTRHLPFHNVLLASLVTALIGGTAHAFGVTGGIPFGSFLFGPNAGQKFFGTLPWTIPLLWVVVILNSRGVARLILRPWRKIRSYGFWLIGLTAGLAALFDFALEPFASRVKHYWIWMPNSSPLAWQGASLANFVGWLAVSLLILAFVTPALINKQLSKPSVPDFHPLAVWLGAIMLFATGAAMNQLWLAAGSDAIVFSIAVVFAIRGARW